jgi:hypothetical protein
MRRIHWALAIVALLVGVVAATTLPASAQPQVLEFSGEVTAGQLIKLECPEGYRVQFNGFFANASADFWRNPNQKGKPFLSNVAPYTLHYDPSNTVIAVDWLVPQGAKSAHATLVCEPKPPPPTTTTAP